MDKDKDKDQTTGGLPTCPEGFKWCSVKEKCIPEDEFEKMHSKHEVAESIEQMVDMYLDGNVKTARMIGKAFRNVDSILEKFVSSKGPIEPIFEGSCLDPLTQALLEEKKEESEYQKFFRQMMDKFGIKSPKELDEEGKKKFFDAVDKGWKAKKETD